MKLLNKSTFYFIISFIPVFFISGFILYDIISHQINSNTDESLLEQKHIIIENFSLKSNIEIDAFNDADDDVKISETSYLKGNENSFVDIQSYDPVEKEMHAFRQLTAFFENNGKFYKL